MKKITALLIWLLLLLSSISYISYTSRLPDLKVFYNKTNVDVLKCPVGWDSFIRSFRADYPMPLELSKYINDTKVKPESPLYMKFNRKPDKIEINIWKNKSEKYEVKDNIIIVPKEKGTYIFEIWGYWKQGEILYILKVEVE